MTSRYPLPTYPNRDLYGPDDPVSDAERDGWTAQDYTLCHALGVEHNRTAEAAVQDAIAGTELAGNVTFDSEMGCFFAYTATEADMDALADAVAGLVAAGPHPDAIPGDMSYSPAFLGTVVPDTVPDRWDS